MTPYIIHIYPWRYPVPVVGARYLVNNRSVHVPAATGTRNAGLFVLNMQLYVNVLIGQTTDHRSPGQTVDLVSLASLLEIIRLYRGALTSTLPSDPSVWVSRSSQVRRNKNSSLWWLRDFILWLARYLPGAICCCVSESLFCNELSHCRPPSQLNEILFSLTKLKQQLSASA